MLSKQYLYTLLLLLSLLSPSLSLLCVGRTLIDPVLYLDYNQSYTHKYRVNAFGQPSEKGAAGTISIASQEECNPNSITEQI